jgi:hypothetical protein
MTCFQTDVFNFFFFELIVRLFNKYNYDCTHTLQYTERYSYFHSSYNYKIIFCILAIHKIFHFKLYYFITHIQFLACIKYF